MQLKRMGSVLLVVGLGSVAVAQTVPEFTDPPHVADPRFPYKTYPNNHPLNDNTPWQTDVVPFDPRRTYTASEQDRIIESEAQIFQAVAPPRPPPGWGGITPEREVNITQPSYPQATTTSVVLDTFQAPLLQPPEGQAEGGTSFNSQTRVMGPFQQSFGNNLFGSRYFSRSELASTRSGGARVESNNEFTATLFNNTRQVVRFLVRATSHCLGVPSQPHQARADIYVMGQRRPSIIRGASFKIERPIWRQDNIEFFRVRKVFMVGPVPMSISASVAGDARLDMGSDLSCYEITLQAEPSAALQVRAAWSVNVIIIQAGIEGRLDLIRVRLPITLTAGVETWTEPCPSWSASIRRDLTTIGGSIKLFTIVRFLFFRQRYNLTIANWRGVTIAEKYLLNQGGSFCPFSTPFAEL